MTQVGPPDQYDWFVLNRELKHIHDVVIKEWESLLKNADSHEENCHSCLSSYAGFFFNNDPGLTHVISKLRLGSDFVTDLILAHDQHSNGLLYEFVELETPSAKSFTKSGRPTARLSAAIQQVADWSEWINENRSEVKKYLPAYGLRLFRNPNFSFTIIIGDRTESTVNLEKRRGYADRLNISIRSFDYLTSRLKRHIFTDHKYQSSNEFLQLPPSISNGFANPFYRAYSDGTWRSLVEDIRDTGHFTAWHAQRCLEYRSYNALFDRFKAEYSQLIR